MAPELFLGVVGNHADADYGAHYDTGGRYGEDVAHYAGDVVGEDGVSEGGVNDAGDEAHEGD